MQIYILLSLIESKGVLLPLPGWGKQFLVQIHMESVLKGDLFLTTKGLGSLVSSAAVAKAEPFCAASLCCTGKL